jgi:hypothetical protein
VQPTDSADAEVCDPTQPEAFIWRGRLYVVRDVLATWRERRAWWREALDADDAQVRPGETLAAAARERQVWRVEASPGWSFTPGVYDLVHDEPGSDSHPGSPGESRPRSRSGSRTGSHPGAHSGARSRSSDGVHSDGGWSLVRVAD